MTLRESILLKFIQAAGWDLRFCWSEQPFFQASKGFTTVIGFTAEEIFDKWSNRPEVIQEVFRLDVRNFTDEVPVVTEQQGEEHALGISGTSEVGSRDTGDGPGDVGLES